MAVIDDIYAYFFGRELRVGIPVSDSPKTVTVPVEIRPYGDEAAVSFTLEYDATKLSNPQIILGDAAPEGSILTTNTNDSGRIGIVIDSTNAFVASAMPKQFVMVRFEVIDTGGGKTPIVLSGSLAAKGAADADGRSLTVRYLDGTIEIPAEEKGK